MRTLTRLLVPALLLLAVPAAGDEPAEPCPKTGVARRFVEAVKAGDHNEAAVNRITELWERMEAAETVDTRFIDASLSVLNVDFSRALVMIRTRRYEEAHAVLSELEREAKDNFLKAAVQFHRARILADSRYWEYALHVLQPLRGDGELADYILPQREVEMLTARALARVARIHEAIEIAEQLTDTEEGRQLLARLEVERDGASLDDVAFKMDEVHELLAQRDTGDDTVAKENKIIAMLDVLIELAEEAEEGGGGGGGGGGAGGADGDNGGSGPASGTGTPSSPAESASLPGGQATDPGEAASTATIGDAWAELDERERARVLDALRQRFPARFGDHIREYFRALSDAEIDD